MHKLKEISLTRNYDRAIDLSTDVRRFLGHVQTVSNEASTNIKNDIKSKLEKVEGFLNVQDEKEKIYAQLAESLAENKDMEVIISRLDE